METMGWESFGIVGFDLGLLRGQTRIAKPSNLKSAHNSLIIGPRSLQCETNLLEVMGLESCGVVGFDLRPLLQGQTRIAKLKMLITRLLLVVQVWDGKPTYRNSWAGNL